MMVAVWLGCFGLAPNKFSLQANTDNLCFIIARSGVDGME